MTNPTINCQGCGRVNGAAAKRCIWCGVPLINQANLDSFETTRVEIGYLDGIERFDDPMAVSFAITPSGIVVNELMPGSRSFLIEADSIIEAKVADTSSTEEGKRQGAAWRRWLAAGLFSGRKPANAKRHDYMLTIRYRSRGEERNAVFHREDRLGLALVDGLARIINSIVKQRAERPGSDDDLS